MKENLTNRYVVLYKASTSVRERFAQATPEQAQQGVQLWIDGQARLGDALVDPGRPIGRAMHVTTVGASDTDSAVVGMSILQANDMAHALTMVEGHHHLAWAEGCEIELLEEMPIPELSAPTQDKA